MASGGDKAPQPDVPPQPPADFAANGHHLYPANYFPHFPQTENPNPYPIPQLFSTGVNTTSFLPAPPGTAPANLFVAPYTYPYGYPVSAPPAYQDPNQIGAVYEIGANLNSNQMAGINQRTNGSQNAPKKLKIVQSWFCDVCKVDCNRKNILDQHKLGKKHKKNLEKLVAANKSVILPAPIVSDPTGCRSQLIKSVILPAPIVSDPAGSSSQLIGPRENPVKGKKNEDLGAKTTKIVKEGAAADSVRVCTICNIVCNSETVMKFHLAGQKHAKEAKKHAWA